MDTKKLKVGSLDLKEKRGSSWKSLKETPQQGLEAPAHRVAARLQPVYLLGVLRPREGTSQWLDTFPRLKLKSFSWESASLTHHCRELVLLANLW
jgi:hypothetical protein